MNAESCRTCRHFEPIINRRADEPAGNLCRHPNWGGYLDPLFPACEGRKSSGATYLIGYASK